MWVVQKAITPAHDAGSRFVVVVVVVVVVVAAAAVIAAVCDCGCCDCGVMAAVVVVGAREETPGMTLFKKSHCLDHFHKARSDLMSTDRPEQGRSDHSPSPP